MEIPRHDTRYTMLTGGWSRRSLGDVYQVRCSGMNSCLIMLVRRMSGSAFLRSSARDLVDVTASQSKSSLTPGRLGRRSSCANNQPDK